jgi:drug/metabolite transporter (DMT)-like permease
MIYIIPLLTIVVFFSLTLGSHKLSERGGRLLKLLAGMMMLELGMLLILNPALLSSATVALILISTALLLTLLAARFLPDRVS